MNSTAIPGLFALGCFALGASSVPVGQHQQPSGQSTDNMSSLFKNKCAPCHVAPDLRFDVEKAWLGQIRETA